MKEIIIASNNDEKIKEVQDILKEYKIVPMKKLGINMDLEENENTFEGNAKRKAEQIAELVKGKLCMADDSGIEIEYLNGFPGVLTKRWNVGTDRDRNEAILEKLKGVPKDKRNVRFVTAIAVSDGINTLFR